MNKSIVFSHIRKTSIKHFLLPIIPLGLAFFLLASLPFKEVFYPIEVSSSQEAIEQFHNGANYVIVNPEKIYYSGYDIMKGDTVDGVYYYDIASDSKCFFYYLDEAKGNIIEAGKNTGIFVKFEKSDGLFENMLELLSSTIDWDYNDLEKITVKEIMVQADNQIWKYQLTFAAILFIIVYCGCMFLSNMIYAIVPVLHPAIRRVKRYNKYKSYKAMSEDLDYQVVTDILEAGGMYITEKYFIHLGAFYVDIIPLNEIVFVYEHSKIRNFSNLHFKISYTLNVKGKKKFRCACPGKSKEDIDIIQQYFIDNMPNILVGYSDENRKATIENIKNRKKKER